MLHASAAMTGPSRRFPWWILPPLAAALALGWLLAVLSFRFGADRWMAETERYRWFGMVLPALILSMAALFVAGVHLQQRQLRRLKDANRIVEGSSTVLFRLKAAGGMPMTYVSENIGRYGRPAAEFIRSPHLYRSLIHPEDAPGFDAAMAGLLAGRAEPGNIDFRMAAADGSYVWFENRYLPVRDRRGRVVEVEGILLDITEGKRAAGEIARLARSDDLTGLANRPVFFERVEQALLAARRNGPKFAILYIDLDHFKDVNDTRGHHVGDLLLKSVAERLRGSLRATDLVARLGGDEFAILQTGVAEASDSGHLAAKLAKLMAQPVQLDGGDVRCTISIGIALYASGVDSADVLIQQADVALYRAKERGRNQYCFHTQELDAEVRNRVCLSGDLRQALTRNEFELHYQPLVELGTGRIIGLEALIRWNHPTRGRLLPAEFLPVAQATGLAGQIGQWAIGEACRQMSQWRDEKIAPPEIAVNLSAAELKMVQDVERSVTEGAKRWSIKSDWLTLEITEAALMETTERDVAAVARLQSQGVRIAIDDFGTGYSSVDHLAGLRAGRLKIDQRFVAGAPKHNRDSIIVRSAIGLARELGMEVVAEGVETAEQCDFLLAAGCEYGQGFLFSRPVDASEAGRLLRQGVIGSYRRQPDLLLA